MRDKVYNLSSILGEIGIELWYGDGKLVTREALLDAVGSG